MTMTVEEIRKHLRDADEGELAALERSLVADTRKGVRTALSQARKRIEAQKAEAARLDGLYEFEDAFFDEAGQGVVVGLDEVGRGSLAGPLAVGAVVLPRWPRIEGLNDSKQVKPDARVRIAGDIQRIALACAVCYVEPGDIDRDGMTVSLRKAFAGALAKIEQMGFVASAVLIDGNPLHMDPREVNIVKGDAKCASIAAASILAKVTRDELMVALADDYPHYGFDENKGYSSASHIKAIRNLGLSPVHRRSFCRGFMQETLF